MDCTTTFVLVQAKAKKIKTFRCSATIQKARVICAESLFDKSYGHDRFDWHSNSMSLPKELYFNDCKDNIRSLTGTDSLELNQCSCNCSFTYFNRID